MHTKRTFVSRNVIFHETVFPYITDTSQFSAVPHFNPGHSFIDDLELQPTPTLIVPDHLVPSMVQKQPVICINVLCGILEQ